MTKTGEPPQVRYETPAPKIAHIVLDRPQKRNAQGTLMTYHLDQALKRACEDDAISVIALAAAGDHFSAGHDLSMSEPAMAPPEERATMWSQYGSPGWEGIYSREREVYLEMTERWRNAPKPVVAAVQGSVISGGLMLMCRAIRALDGGEHPMVGRLPGVGARIPETIRHMAAIVLIGMALFGIISLILANIGEVAARAPDYQQRLLAAIQAGADLLKIETEPTWETLRQDVLSQINLQRAMGTVAASLASIVATFSVVVIYAGFLLTEKGAFDKKVGRLSDDPARVGTR